MIIEGKNPSAIASNIINAIGSNLDMESITPGGVIHTLSLAVGNEIAKIYANLIELYSNTYLSEAGGPYLDALGSFLGLSRIKASPIEEITGVRFYAYNSSALSNYINSSFFESSVEVKLKGTDTLFTVKPMTLTGEQLARNYVDVSLLPVNVLANYAEKNTLTEYEPSITGLLCTNMARIKMMANAETDDQFRYRISRFIATRRPFNNRNTILSNTMMLRIAALAVAGVADVVIDSYSSGSGSITIYVVAEDLINDSSLPALVSERIGNYVGYGVKAKVTLPQKTFITIRANVYSNDVVSAVSEASESIRKLIDSVPVGGSINRLDIHNTLFKTTGVMSADNIEIKLSYLDKVGISHSRVFNENKYTCGQFEKLVASSDLIVGSW